VYLQEECQLGRTKLFVRQPETFFELEKLRVKMVGNLVASIQRGWRRFRDRRKFVLMQQVLIGECKTSSLLSSVTLLC
jgi:myosin heavy subunit